jgi:hypothetical protein
VRYRVSIEHRETYIVDASCAAEAQFVAADFATNRNNSEYAEQVLEHMDESLQYLCTQLEACHHTSILAEDQLDA